MRIRNTHAQIDPQHFQRIAQLDLAPIAYQLKHSDATREWNEVQIQRAIAQYRQFLYLVVLYPERTLVPTETIDQVWHCHILDTMKYAQDCEQIFGYFVHHFPYFGVRGERDRRNWQDGVQQTQALFEEHFGIDNTNPQVWSQAADCQPVMTVMECDRPALNLTFSLPLPC